MDARSQYRSRIPGHLLAGIDRYIDHGYLPGGFLQAVLENKLKEAFERADTTSLAAMHDIVKYLYNFIPMAAWGSPERVTEWTAYLRAGKLNSQARQTGVTPDAVQPELQEGL